MAIKAVLAVYSQVAAIEHSPYGECFFQRIGDEPLCSFDVLAVSVVCLVFARNGTAEITFSIFIALNRCSGSTPVCSERGSAIWSVNGIPVGTYTLIYLRTSTNIAP